MLSLLRHMVEIESPSDDKAAVDRMGAFLAQEFERLGGKVTFFPQKEAGNHLKAEFPGVSGKPVLLLGHFDTVWSMGTLAKMPFRLEGGRAFGPGVYDMKAGIAMMIFALRALKEAAANIGQSLSYWILMKKLAAPRAVRWLKPQQKTVKPCWCWNLRRDPKVI